MNPPSGPATTFTRDGSASIASLAAEVMMVLLAVSSPRLEKRIRTRIMMARDTNPPVAVVN